MKLLVIAAALSALSASAFAINKCTAPDGKVTFQDAPCAGKGEKITVQPNSGLSLPKSSLPVKLLAASEAPASSAPPAPELQKTPVKSALEQEANTCLAWYKPKLRDPAGAYYSEPSKEGRVVSITVHATNGYGGYTTKEAACEILNSRLDSDWTKIHAKRHGWSSD